MSYDRYSRFRVNGKITKVPSVSLTEKSTDYFEVYKRGVSRLDNISYKYYDDPSYDGEPRIRFNGVQHTRQRVVTDSVPVRVEH